MNFRLNKDSSIYIYNVPKCMKLKEKDKVRYEPQILMICLEQI